MIDLNNMAVYGGTFDPIHNGHINTAINIQNYFNFGSFVFLPCKSPVLKPVFATPKQRLAMLKLALANYSHLNITIDQLELKRKSPSYTINTLKYLRVRKGEGLCLSLIIGFDNFIQLPKWHQWQKLLDFCNLLVIKRALNNSRLPTEVISLNKQKGTSDPYALLESKHGLIYHFDAGTYPFSSTEIRSQIAKGQFPHEALPANVIEYIQQNKIYVN